MVSLDLANDSDYLFTEPFSPRKLKGEGVGPDSRERVLRAEDLMFIYEAIKEFYWYNHEGIHWAGSFSSRDKYPSYNLLEKGILKRPDNTIISNSRLGAVNGPGGNPYWFDYNANFSATQSEHFTLPDLYVLFGMTSDDCYHIRDLWQDFVSNLYASTKGRIPTLDLINRFYKAIPMLHSMWIKVDPKVEYVTITTETTRHKGGKSVGFEYFKNRDGSDTAHIESVIYPDIDDFPLPEQSSTSTGTGLPSSMNKIYEFSGKTYSKIGSVEMAHRGQGEYEYIDDGYYTAFDVVKSYSYVTDEKSAPISVIFELWPSGANYSMESYKVFAKISHELEITEYKFVNDLEVSRHTLQSYTKYKLVDVTGIFSASIDSGKICLKAAIDADTFKNKMQHVQDYGSMDYPEDPIPEVPLDGTEYKNERLFRSKIDLIGMFAVVKPDYNAKYSGEQVSPISEFIE